MRRLRVMPAMALVFDPSEPSASRAVAANDTTPPPAADDGDMLDAYSRAVVDVVQRVGPAVVSIARASRGGPAGAGSGVAFAPDGYVLTNAHVASGADELMLGFTDGTTDRARV